jgi:hypothetical protein
MKIKFLMAGMLGLISAAAFAQKGELNTAKEAVRYLFEALKGSAGNGISELAVASLTAKEAIDKAAANEKTSYTDRLPTL